jgi:RNA polymerase primary sigma factor
VADTATGRAPSALDALLANIQRYPLLTEAEEQALGRRAQLGDLEAQQRLVEHNMRFVVRVARPFARTVPLEDLVQEGVMGMMRAAQKFDPDRGVRFVAYAAWWIKQSIRAALARDQRTVRVPINRSTQLHQIRRAVDLIGQHLGRTPTTEELAAAMGLPLETVVTLQAIDQQDVSLNEPLGPEDGIRMEERLTAEDDRDGADRRTLHEDRILAMEQLLAHLRPRDAQVIRLAYGLGTGITMTLDEIGIVLGITRERVRQLRDRAVGELRKRATPHMEALLDEVFRTP